ncbi:MAG TPA: hypothetical protein VFL27_04955 [Candidatus Dormibacteraeota bacterium]|nr:hypothetical protein [Candidatus Dormibacteraeota bacterium]
MQDERRDILNQVAAGTITAQEGAARLEALESPAAAPNAPAPPAAPPAPSAGAIKQLDVITRFGNTQIIGDPNVASAVAEGPHRARQSGDTMVIEQTPLTDETSFEFTRSYGRVVIPRIDFDRGLTVRVNPELILRTKVQAGNLRIEGVKGPVTTDVKAGNCVVEGFAGPVNLSVMAGNIEARGRLDRGASSVRCQMGEVKVHLDRSSSVRINARSTLGDVAVEGVEDRTLGTGAGTLDIDCTMGNVRVDVV